MTTTFIFDSTAKIVIFLCLENRTQVMALSLSEFDDHARIWPGSTPRKKQLLDVLGQLSEETMPENCKILQLRGHTGLRTAQPSHVYMRGLFVI